ncbi:P-loop containing nucleoside triphosphate hydrolase protein [Serendipita vermifera]|nr:P-loop containing nucleoside triphosphate hydrolase protein [Serendipita vermifera]
MSSTRSPDVIVVLGNTGCGKSTFINDASRSNDMVVSCSFKSCTTKVTATRPFDIDDRPIILLDTPGFDNTQGASFREIMDEVKIYLTRELRQNTVQGIIFLQAIDETKALDSTMTNIRQFHRICGNDIRYALVVATTRWDRTQQDRLDVATRRERELQMDVSFLKIFADARVTFKRHPSPSSSKSDSARSESARDIVRCLLDPRNKPRKKSWWKILFLW